MKIKKHNFNGFGFPVTLLNVPAREIRGKIEPIINYKELAETVISLVCSDENTHPLTGHEVFFLRNHLGMTLREFAEVLDVTHPAVKDWESCKDKSTKMNSTTEKILRLKMLNAIGTKPSDFVEVFERLKIDRSSARQQTPIQVSM